MSHGIKEFIRMLEVVHVTWKSVEWRWLLGQWGVGTESAPECLLFSLYVCCILSFAYICIPFSVQQETWSAAAPKLHILLLFPEKNWLSSFISRSFSPRECLWLVYLAQVTNWTKYLWPEELMPLILTDEKNHCELGSGPNDRDSYIEKMARMCLRYV